MTHPAQTEASATPRPWYRNEPWAAAALAAFLPLGGALALPQSFRVPLIALAGLLLVLACTLLVRQGLFDGHDEPSDP